MRMRRTLAGSFISSPKPFIDDPSRPRPAYGAPTFHAMTRPRRLFTAVAAAAVFATACSGGSDNSASTSVGVRPSHAFDHVRHVALEQVDTDDFETVTAFAHVCAIGSGSCPDGNEPMIILGSHEFMPHDAHLRGPDVMLQPPAECLADGSYCVLTLAKCAFATRDDQLEAEHCIPEGSHIETAAASVGDGEQHDCVEARAEHSRHVDLECLRATAMNVEREGSSS